MIPADLDGRRRVGVVDVSVDFELAKPLNEIYCWFLVLLDPWVLRWKRW